MAIFVAAIDGMTSHDAADVSRLETAFLSQEGVVGITASDLLVEAQGTPDMTVKVNPGSCFVLRDTHVNNDNTLKFWHVVVSTNTNVTIPSADASNPRIDLICVKVDTSATPDATASNVATLVNVQGTAAVSPSRPVVPANHLELAEISVPALDTTISAGQITDTRAFTGFALRSSGTADGYRLRDTGGNLDAQIYEDSAGRLVIRSQRSGGALKIDPVQNKVQFKNKAQDSYSDMGSGSDGWTEITGTLAYSSADDPVFVATTSTDLSGTIQVGDRIKLTQTTAKYFIVVAITASIITLYGGTDYDLVNAGITTPYYSHQKNPYGFPSRPDKWIAEASSSSSLTQGSPVNGTWYNLGSLSLSIPIGLWRVEYMTSVDGFDSAGVALMQIFATLSTANNSESDSDFTSVVVGRSAGTDVTEIASYVYKAKVLNLSSKTTYFLNAKSAAGSIDSVTFPGNDAKIFIRAICAYL